MKTSAKKVVTKKSVKTPAKKVLKKEPVSIKVTAGAVKKVAAKKTVAPKTKKELIVASNYNSFWMNDGQILNTLAALGLVLKNMDQAVYKYHTANGRHDFANWVEDVLVDIDCATALRKAKTPKAAQVVVLKYLAFYK